MNTIAPNSLCARQPHRLVPQPRHPSALAELVDYVSDHLPTLEPQGAQPVFSARGGRLVLVGDRVEAEVGPFTLGSQRRRLVAAVNPAQSIAWSSTLRVRSHTGREINDETLIRLQTTDTAAVAMDRLCRTLHMLNHLACAREDDDLWVPISLRHLLAVAHDHGAYFEDLLRRCGLGPQRIVLVLPLPVLRETEQRRLLLAVQAYQQRGFRLALAATGLLDDSQTALIEQLAPAALKIHPRDLAVTRSRLPAVPLLLSPGNGRFPLSVGAADLLELDSEPAAAFLI